VPVIDPQLLLSAYCQGYFPMGMRNGEVRWFLPESRGVLPVAEFHVPQRFEQYLKKHPFEVRWNTAFAEVMRAALTAMRLGSPPTFSTATKRCTTWATRTAPKSGATDS